MLRILAAKMPRAATIQAKMAVATTKKTTTNKRKIEEKPAAVETSNSNNDNDKSASSSSKPKPAAKKAKGPTVPLHANLPNNKTFPAKLEFTAKKDDTLRISAWNVCGINACEKKGLKTYLMAEDPDIIILSETKTQTEPDIMHIKHQFKYRYWGGDLTKGYAGVAILSKHKPIEVIYGLPTAEDQSTTKGRMITLEFASFFLIGTYTPNAGDNLKFMDRKTEWNVSFEKFLRELDAKKPVVWGGDINCALTEKDIRNATSNWNKTAGYTQEETDGLNSQLNPSEDSGHEKLVDVWRELNPDLEGHYTYFSYRFGCREKGIGWRIDSFITSQRVFEKVKACEIRQECYGASDHVPIIIDIDLSP
ncbi:exodeoxyribonuclease III, variant [Puccinia striiformis f. sp. tritici PST-78]|uniref:DNA-(apurinic or apyrimidinic site) endonuclease n=1 Tax=Puccinia striiformis f. sp. tritici PST-78 TaxID=1165861 RepID=A0A0L0V656_9BASI|nr:exodeoxyribonuclease III [Puccinia striiformis f. sp. tritici PST-78]KNE94764.1 exodeoxyribonuclease III, variant [Puccinia striiformis f. sp. tritici PST-78]